MASTPHLSKNLSPAQMIALQDDLLASADRLRTSALSMIERGLVPVARLFATSSVDKTRKAIVTHQRRDEMSREPEGAPFVNNELRELWDQRELTPSVVYDFLMFDDYGFETTPADSDETRRVMETINNWRSGRQSIHQRDVYVAEPDEVVAIHLLLDRVHQIGWQLRMGEHIEAQRLERAAQDIPPATEEEIEEARWGYRNIDPEIAEGIINSKRRGTKGKKFNNAAYAFTLAEDPFENMHKPGYEAQDRKLSALSRRIKD